MPTKAFSDADLRRVCDGNKTISEVAANLGVSSKTVASRGRTLGLTFAPARVQVSNEAIHQAFRDGLTLWETAERIGCSLSAVKKRAGKLKLKFKSGNNPVGRRFDRIKPKTAADVQVIDNPMARFAAMENAAMNRVNRGGL